MENHVKLVGILNIVYHSLTLFGAVILLMIGVGFGYLYEVLIETGEIHAQEIPEAILNLIPLILIFIASLIFILGVAGITGGIGVLKKTEWGRILLLVVSFFSLIRIPLGTILGIYTIWILISNEAVKMFTTGSSGN